MLKNISFSSLLGRGERKIFKLALLLIVILLIYFVRHQKHSKKTKPLLYTEPELEKKEEITICCNDEYFYIAVSKHVLDKLSASDGSKIVSAYHYLNSDIPVEILINDVVDQGDIKKFLSILSNSTQNIVYICPDEHDNNTFCVLHWLNWSDHTQYRRHTCNHKQTQCNIIDVPDVPSDISSQNILSSYRRKVFCNKYSKYKEYCTDTNLMPIDFVFKPVYDAENDLDYQQNIDNIPIVIVASNRPHYLIQCIQDLLSTNGVRLENIVVHTDSPNEEVQDVAQLFGLKYERFRKVCTSVCQTTQHYLYLVEKMFKAFPQASELILIEEDLFVAPDIMAFFSSTIDYLRENSAYYCISAWNDQSYGDPFGDQSLLYLSQAMPGLGWILKRDLFFYDLLPVWPNSTQDLDWNIWMRRPEIQKGRECIIPDVSRTFRFEIKGNSLNEYMPNRHFKTRYSSQFEYVSFNVSWLEDNSYDTLMRELIRKGTQVAQGDLCSIGLKSFIEHKNVIVNKTIHNHDYLVARTIIICIKGSTRDAEIKWLSLTRCWGISEMEFRGMHNGVIRVWFNGLHYLVIMKEHTTYDINGLNCE